MMNESDSMDDQQENPRSFEENPEKLAPQQPVLEQPLDDKCREETRPDTQPAEQLPEDSLHQPTQEVQVFHSPFFPRGIYEDAASVEAYYGRTEPEPGYDPFCDSRHVDQPNKKFRLNRLVLIVIALLMIVILVLSAAMGGYTLPII